MKDYPGSGIVIIGEHISRQRLQEMAAHLWGINIYPEKPRSEWVEFDSMIIFGREGAIARAA